MNNYATAAQLAFQGIQAGASAYAQNKRDKLQDEKDAARALLQSEQMASDIRERGLDRIAADDRYYAGQEAAERRRSEAATSESNDPREQVAKARASLELEQLGKPPVLSENDQLAADVKRLELQKARAALEGPAVAPVPMAKVRRNLGTDGKEGFAEFQTPVADLEKTAGTGIASNYKSPYADEIARLGSASAKQRAEIAGGDNRTGFLGVGSSRADLAATADRQRLQLKALEIKDMLESGVIDKTEADRRANALMGVK
jgi:hypothetical protein